MATYLQLYVTAINRTENRHCYTELLAHNYERTWRVYWCLVFSVDLKVKVKVKLSCAFLYSAPCHEGVLGEWRHIFTHFFTSALDGGDGKLHALATLPQGKSPWYPLDRRRGGPQSRSGCRSEEKNSQPLPGLELPIIQSVAQRYTTELFRFLFSVFNSL
jgi:hypothetical protein